MQNWKTDSTSRLNYIKSLNKELDEINRSLQDLIICNETLMYLENKNNPVWVDYNNQYNRWMKIRAILSEITQFERNSKLEYV